MDPITRDFMPRHPGLKLDISLTDRHVDLIREGFDIAVRAGNVADSDLSSRLLGKLPMVLAASPGYLAARGAPESTEALRDHAHIRYMLGGKPFPLRFSDGTEFTPEGAFDTDSGVASRIAALNGVGIVQMLRFAIQDDIDAGRLEPVLPDVPLPLVSVYALHAFGRHVPARARLFIDFLALRMANLDSR